MKAAIFDVDGTIINGNCNKIFIEYLFERNFVTQKDFIPFNKKYALYLKSEISYSEIIRESLNIFSRFKKDELIKLWNNCYVEIVAKKFNKEIINHIRKYQHQGLEIILASGSYFELISSIAEELKINKNNIFASDTSMFQDVEAVETANVISYGIEKKKLVTDYLRKSKFGLKDCYVFTDNISDFDLLKTAGTSFWVGSEVLYSEHNMQKCGINRLKINSVPDTSKRQLLKNSKPLFDYYSTHQDIIEESILEIFPVECTSETMDYLVGNIDLKWDCETLQTSFFDPLNAYLNSKNEKIISLGTCLFLETGGIDINHYKPILAMGELLDTSCEIFFDIQEWTSVGRPQTNDRSHLDISIIGNVAIALISLPTHNIIYNGLEIEDDKRLKLYESYTSIVFNTLFGNGIKLSWEHKKNIDISIKEYCKVAFLTNMGQLKIPGDLWLILQEEGPGAASVEVMDAFIKNMSIAIQLQKDLLAFERWEKQLSQSKINSFNLLSNILCIHSASHFNNPSIFSDNLTLNQIRKVVNDSGSVKYTKHILSKYLQKANNALDKLTTKRKYKNLINAYANCMIIR